MDENTEENTALKVLQTVLQGDGSELLKANKGDGNSENDNPDPDDDDDDNDNDNDDYSYNKKGKKKGYNKKMGYAKKARDLETEYDNRQSEFDEADAVVVDGTDMFNLFKAFAGDVNKFMNHISKRMEILETHAEYQTQLAKASGTVLIDNSKVFSSFAKTPNLVRGIDNIPVGSNEQNNTQELIKAKIQKVVGMGIPGIKGILMKAVLNGNQNAGKALTQIECCHNNLKLIPSESMQLIAELADAK